MSTKEKQKRGTGAAAVVIILCAAALAALGWVVYRQLCPAVPETVEMYAASETEDAPSYEDAERTPLGSILRGAAVQCVKEDVDSGAELVRVENGLLDGKVSYLYMERANLAATPEDSVLTETVYALRGMSLTDNVMPDEVRALYLNGSAIQYADSYIRLAQGTGINAFVVDIVDGTAVSYASPVMQQYSPSAYAAAQDTMENFRANVQKLRDAGFYTIGRITVFNDAHLAADHPEYVISDLSGTPLKISSMYWPSAYNRTVWQYKTELALEAAALGFNEIQFDYIRFPDGAYKYEQAGTIDYKNTYNAIREPYNHYGAAELADEVRALRDTGNTGGFMTWNGASDIGKYAEVIGALN